MFLRLALDLTYEWQEMFCFHRNIQQMVRTNFFAKKLGLRWVKLKGTCLLKLALKEKKTLVSALA
jgi:hypothetical protein